MSEEKKSKEEKNDKKENSKVANSTTACCGDEHKKGNGSIFVWLIIIIAVIGAIIFFQQKQGNNGSEAKPVSDKVSKEVSKAAMDLIEGQLVAPGTKVDIKEVAEESGLYKIKLSVADQEITSYMTKDKKKFIPQLIDVKELENAKDEKNKKNKTAPLTEVQAKSDKPNVELFVMSYCPYGTQMEKGYLPVIKTLGNSIDSKIKFVDYSMHGEKEINENLRQYCIEKNEPNKYADYLTCFLASKSGSEQESKACMKKFGVNANSVKQCMDTTDKKYDITKLAKDKSTYVSGQFPQFNIHKEDNEKYGVEGSPTLVINGELIQTGRDSESILKAICSAFNEQPEACKKELSTTSPSPGFGTGADKTGASDSAGCGA